jgi:hypothetical protein
VPHANRCMANIFLWIITVAIFFQLNLAVSQAVMLASGVPTLLAVLKGDEAIILIFVLGSSIANSIAYAIGVDVNS